MAPIKQITSSELKSYIEKCVEEKLTKKFNDALIKSIGTVVKEVLITEGVIQRPKELTLKQKEQLQLKKELLQLEQKKLEIRKKLGISAYDDIADNFVMNEGTNAKTSNMISKNPVIAQKLKQIPFKTDEEKIYAEMLASGTEVEYSIGNNYSGGMMAPQLPQIGEQFNNYDEPVNTLENYDPVEYAKSIANETITPIRLDPHGKIDNNIPLDIMPDWIPSQLPVGNR